MDHHRQQAALTLEPDLVEIVLDLAANAQIVDQNMGIGRHRLLMQTDMTIRIYVRDGEHMVALRQQLAGQRRGTVRQVQQDPLVVPALFQALQCGDEAREQALVRGFIPALGFGQLTKGKQIELGGITQTRIPPVFIVQKRTSPAVCMRKVDIE